MISALKVSVVMPAYNAAVCLEEAVESVLGRTFRAFEFVIINNGCSDNTADILDNYRRQDRRIQVYYHKEEGLAPALNDACRLAHGEYIALMDAHDVSLARRLQEQVNYLDRNPPDRGRGNMDLQKRQRRFGEKDMVSAHELKKA